MNFEPTDDQAMVVETFARFLDGASSTARVRAALPTGFDRVLWQRIAEMGGLSILVPEVKGGLGMGVFDAVLVMEQAGRTLVSGPLAEAMVAAQILAGAESAAAAGILAGVLDGSLVVTLALHDAGVEPVQWVPGGAVADRVLMLDGEAVVLVTPAVRQAEPNLAGTPLAEIDMAKGAREVLAAGPVVVAAFRAGIEILKLLTASALAGLAREAIRLACIYAGERSQFGQLIGTYQGVSHPLADVYVEVEGGKYLVWKTIRDIADQTPEAAAEIPLALWWNANAASRAVAQALHTFGGYGLTTEYDIHLYNLRAKDWSLVWGDPATQLDEGARLLYAAAPATLPSVGSVPIDFDKGEDARALAAEVRAFFDRTLTPELKAKAHYSFDGHDAGVQRKLAEARLLFPTWPAALGGRDASPYAASAARSVWEEYNWTSHAAGTTGMVGAIIARFGTEELKREVLDRIVAGEVVCSLGFSEPASGSDVFSARTRAVPDGNGWRIDGQKMFTSGADIADYVLMLTRTDPDVPKHKGLTMFIVPLKGPGVQIQAVHTFQDERTNITFYDEVRIPDYYRLGEVGGGVRVMSASLELEHGASFLDSQRHLLHQAETVCRQTRRRGRPMIEDAMVAARLARVFTANAVTEVLALRSLWASVEKKPNAGFGSMVKLFSSERFRIDSADLLDLTAPESLSKRDGPAAYINLSYRHAQGTTIYGGTSEVHRSMIAERALALPRTRA